MKRLLRYSAFYIALIPELLISTGHGQASLERNQIETMSMFRAVVVNIAGLGFLALTFLIIYVYIS